MKQFNLPNIYCDWLYAYLGNRTQRVNCNNIKSGLAKITYGVPQGSILGPLLFICYINNLPNIVKNCRVLMYADDVVFYTSHECPATARAKLQEDANAVYKWFTSSGLSINTEKTKIVVFSHDVPLAPVDLKIKMGNHTLSTCSQYEYLGVILDSNLTLERSVSKSVSNTNFRSVMLRKMRGKLTRPTAILVYKQTIQPVLEYCGFLYNGITEYQHKRLQLTQNKCLRTCLNVRRRYHVVDLHLDTNVDYLSIRYDMQLLLLIYKYV